MFDPSFAKNRTISQVFNGDFPREAVKKMNRKCLERLVLRLVECSSDDVGAKDAKDFTGLYRGLCLKEINKPEWWPSERIIAQSLTSDGKYFMELLRFLVYKCCQFFKKPSENLNDKIFVTENTENSRGLKRKCNETTIHEFPNKRRTLMPKNVAPKSVSSSDVLEQTFLKSPVIRLRDILYKSKPKPLTQDGFLNIFGLQNIFHHNIEDLPIPSVPSVTIKFNTCSVIPFSSDLGRELMKRDNHICPEALKSRRLERLEWYVNKSPSRCTEMKYEVSYQEKKDLTFRSYTFPKRQIWQHPGDVNFQKKALLCQRLTIVLVRQDLIAIQKKLKKTQRKLSVVVSRMSIKTTNSEVNACKNVKNKLSKCVKEKNL